MSLNEAQQRIADHSEGMIIVDAGPGTGKTHTITKRYVNLIKSGISPSEILMVTFTRNSAGEMADRIRGAIIKEADEIRRSLKGGRPATEAGIAEARERQRTADLLNGSKDQIMTSTFDALCLRTVLGSPEVVSDFFGFGETLSRGASLVQNETLNVEYFESFYSRFALENASLYRRKGFDIPALAAGGIPDLYEILVRLMSYGIIPLRDDEWFGNGRKMLLGSPAEAMARLAEANDCLGKLDPKYTYAPDCPVDMYLLKKDVVPDDDGKVRLSEETLGLVVNEDRDLLIYFLRHVYYEYIRQSVRDNRLTFSLVKIFAFAVLHESEFAREQNSVSYLMVDEFQDTDEIQLKICLMLLKKDNLCVVGDWKQGIYGFRNASVDNILRFTEKADDFAASLGKRVRFDFDADRCTEERLSVNYRSTRAILDPAFRAMEVKGSKDECVSIEEGSVTPLESFRESPEEKHSGLYREYTGCDYMKSSSSDREYADIADRITEYMYSGRYMIVEDGKARPPEFRDICVLFRGVKPCNMFFSEAVSRGIPVFLQGDTEIMSSKAGKLALAWLRFVNDSNDKRGISAILVHEGYSLSQIRAMFEEAKTEGMLKALPAYIVDERRFIKRKSRRPNDMLTSIFAFHRIGEDDGLADVAQAVINVISSSYSDSLMTIPDIIRLIEEDIVQSTRYPVDAILGRSAVTVQTMHKSKGLEYPIVIVGGLNARKMPLSGGSKSLFTYDDVYGIRSRMEFHRADNGICGLVSSWRYRVISNARSTNYDEERRLLFVAMSRAEQYMTVAAGEDPSWFFKELSAGGTIRAPEAYDVPQADRTDNVTEDPVVPGYVRRRRNLAVHDIMTYEPGSEGGKGIEYGNLVHSQAHQMVLGKAYDESLPELGYIRELTASMKGARLAPELDCALPVGDVTLRGVIDLLADFGDRIEVHDYKTDIDRRNTESYRLQVSVYAHAVSGARNVPVRCFLDFVTLGQSVEVDIMPVSEIAGKVSEYLAHSEPVEGEDI